MVRGFLGDRLPSVVLPPWKRRKVIGSCGHSAVSLSHLELACGDYVC
jgi:hypothetical protein